MQTGARFWVFLACFMWSQIYGISLRTSDADEADVEVPVKKIKPNPIFKSRYRYDNNERNTSADYDLWNQAGFHLFEWPGNISVMDHNFPLLKWGQPRARLLRSPCEKERGMELAVYSYKYLHLTWGANHLTRSYCTPLRVDRQKLSPQYRSKQDYEMTIIDYDFAFDALLLVTEEGDMIRVGEIELSYGRTWKRVRRNLTSSAPKGLSSKISRVISQRCCSKAMDTCPHGDAVVAYNETSTEPRVFISYDGGRMFEELRLSSSQDFGALQALVFYPNWRLILVVHGSNALARISHYSSLDGSLVRDRNVTSLPINGYVQAFRISNEMSFLIWDDCSVWYAQPGESEISLVPAKFYIHSSLVQQNLKAQERKNPTPHVVRRNHCYLGRNALLTAGDEGKLGILDSRNLFLYSVDLKSKNFTLVGLSTDMTLLRPDKANTIVPSFDRNNRPKLSYPPRYLQLPLSMEGLLDENYKKRLAMRIVPKTLFPSDFMEPFYQENLGKEPSFQQLGLRKCQTSSLSIDGAISQKPKRYRIGTKEALSFIITFTSYNDHRVKLQYEPKLIHSLVEIITERVQLQDLGGGLFWNKYSVNITLKPREMKGAAGYPNMEIFLLNFFTVKSLRCVHQPQFPVWIKIDKDYIPPVSRPFKQPTIIPKTVEQRGVAQEPLRVDHCPMASDLDRLSAGTCSGIRRPGILTAKF